MAGVTIDSGELPSAVGVGEGHPLFLIITKWQRIAGSFHEDCRLLKQMIEETDRLRLWEKNVGGFTFKDRDDFLRRKVLIDYELTEQDMIEIVTALKHDQASDVCQKLARLGKRGTNQHTVGVGNTKSSDKGMTAKYITARLERDGHAELAAKVRSHEMPADAAAKQVGYRKPVSVFDACQKLIRKSLPMLTHEQCEKLRQMLE